MASLHQAGPRAACAYATPPPLAPLLADGACTWPTLWRQLQGELRRRGYRRGTRAVYRQVLRGLARTAGVAPAQIARDHVNRHLRRLAVRRRSASWLAANLCVLRTVFDKLGGRDLLANRRGPRRPHRLPVVLNREEAARVLTSAADLREGMMLGLLYGCGLKVGELCALHWGDFDAVAGTVSVAGSEGGASRTLRLPAALGGICAGGAAQFGPGCPVFRGRSPGGALSVRMVERVVRRCAVRAGIVKPVSPMVLRHSYAVHSLEDGGSIREVQVALGHCSLETTLRYLECLRPVGVDSPLDVLYRDATPEVFEEVEQELAEPRPLPVWARAFAGLGRLLRLRTTDPPC
jgi:site-specific recombinase XerD